MWIKVQHILQGGWGAMQPHSVPILINTDNISFITPGEINSVIHFISDIPIGMSRQSKSSLQTITIAVCGADIELALTGGRLEKLIKLGIVDDS